MEGLPPSFHSFSRLPVEVQRAIWYLSLPLRVLEVDEPVFWDMVDDHGIDGLATICTLDHTTWLNRRPPLITRVCRLSRSVAFAAGDFIPPRNRDGRPLRSKHWTLSRISNSSVWKDREHDSFHINWTLNAEWEKGDSIGLFSDPDWTAERIVAPRASGRASLMLQAFVTQMDVDEYESPGFGQARFTMPLPPLILRELKVLQMLPEWLARCYAHRHHPLRRAKGREDRSLWYLRRRFCACRRCV